MAKFENLLLHVGDDILPTTESLMLALSFGENSYEASRSCNRKADVAAASQACELKKVIKLQQQSRERLENCTEELGSESTTVYVHGNGEITCLIGACREIHGGLMYNSDVLSYVANEGSKIENKLRNVIDKCCHVDDGPCHTGNGNSSVREVGYVSSYVVDDFRYTAAQAARRSPVIFDRVKVATRLRSRAFPPPISSLLSEDPPVMLSFKGNGRFRLQRVANSARRIFRATRAAGRLRLLLIIDDDEKPTCHLPPVRRRTSSFLDIPRPISLFTSTPVVATAAAGQLSLQVLCQKLAHPQPQKLSQAPLPIFSAFGQLSELAPIDIYEISSFLALSIVYFCKQAYQEYAGHVEHEDSAKKKKKLLIEEILSPASTTILVGKVSCAGRTAGLKISGFLSFHQLQCANFSQQISPVTAFKIETASDRPPYYNLALARISN